MDGCKKPEPFIRIPLIDLILQKIWNGCKRPESFIRIPLINLKIMPLSIIITKLFNF